MPRFKAASGRWRDGWLIAFFGTAAIVILGALLSAVIVVTTDANYHFAVQGCRHWSEQIGRPSKEVRYTWGTWDCLTPNPAVPGTWIPANKLWVVNK